MYEVCQCIANVADFCRCIHYRFLFCLFLPSFDININDDILQLSNFPAMELFILKNTGSWAFTQHIFFWWSSPAVWIRASARAVGDFDRARVSTRYSRKRGMRKQTAFSVLSCNCPRVSVCVCVLRLCAFLPLNISISNCIRCSNPYIRTYQLSVSMGHFSIIYPYDYRDYISLKQHVI